jgi:hypothetical protein
MPGYKMKLSDILNIISSIMTFVLILFVVGRVKNTACFNWFDYFTMFGTLFGNIGINILASLKK